MHPVPRAQHLFLAILYGIPGVLILTLQPLAFGPLVAAGRLHENEMGLQSGVETAALALASALLPGWLSGADFRIKLAMFALIMALCNILTTVPMTAAMLIALRGVCGLAEGGILAGAFIVLFAARDPDRINAIFLVVSNILVAVASFFIPAILVPRYGVASSFWLMAVVGLSAMGLSVALRHRPVAMLTPVMGWNRWSGATYLVLAGTVAQNAALMAGWAFLESTARFHGFDASVLGVSASLAVVAQIFGALAIALGGYRLPAKPALALGSIGMALAVYWLGHPLNATTFTIANAILGFLWLAMTPLGIKLIVEVEPTRQAVYLTAPAQFLGLSLGPMIAAIFVTNLSVAPAYGLACIFGVFASAIFMMVSHRTAAIDGDRAA